MTTVPNNHTSVWVSWNENIRHNHQHLHIIKTEKELADCVAQHDSVRVFGHRFSSADICAGTDALIDLTQYNQIIDYNDEIMEITIQSGTTLGAVMEAVEAKGWTIPCLPDITGITMGGALATGTHGTGQQGHILSQYMVRCTLVLATGDVLTIEENDPRMPAVRVSLGVLGVLSQITLRCVPIYTLHINEAPMHDDVWLSQLDALHKKHDFLRILWLPHTDHGYVITGDRISEETPVTTEPSPSWLKHRRRVSKILYQYTHQFPHLTAIANKILYRLFFTAKKSHKGTLYGATVTKKRGSTMELAEWTIAKSRFKTVFTELKKVLDDPTNRAYAHVPMDIRFVEEDDTWLSYAYGEPCVTVGCVCRDSPNADAYAAFESIESVFLAHGGRPHWAKRFRAKATEMADLYPRWQDFNILRDQMDPTGKFLNPYLDTLFNA